MAFPHLLNSSSSSEFTKPQTWSSFSDSDKLIRSKSSSAEFTKPQTWSSFTDSNELIHSNRPSSANLEPPALPPVINSHSSWSPCPAWSSFQGSSDDRHDEPEDASSHSHSNNQSDQDYAPANTFNSPITAPNPQSDNIIQPSQAIRMLLFYSHYSSSPPYSHIVSNPSFQFTSLDGCLSKSRMS